MKTTILGDKIPENIKEAKDYVIEFFRTNYLWNIREAIQTNNGRHYLLVFYDPEENRNVKVYLVFQREWFHKFREYFGYDGEASTINYYILLKLIREDVDYLVWVNDKGEIYSTDPRYMLRLVEENNWIRVQDKTGEQTCHMPVKLLSRLK